MKRGLDLLLPPMPPIGAKTLSSAAELARDGASTAMRGDTPRSKPRIEVPIEEWGPRSEVPMSDLIRIVLISRGPMTIGEIGRVMWGNDPMAKRKASTTMTNMRKAGSADSVDGRWFAT